MAPSTAAELRLAKSFGSVNAMVRKASATAMSAQPTRSSALRPRLSTVKTATSVQTSLKPASPTAAESPSPTCSKSDET